jgi:flotillin
MVKDAEQEKRIAVASAEAKAVAGEADSMALIASTRAALHVREAEAYQLSETRKREAEAYVQEAQNRAMARAALADAERVEAVRRAELEAPAKAEKARTIVEAEAEAQRRRIEAEAEAAAIYMKLEAEARGQYEIMSKKAEAMKELVLAAGGAKEAFQLMMVEHLDVGLSPEHGEHAAADDARAAGHRWRRAADVSGQDRRRDARQGHRRDALGAGRGWVDEHGKRGDRAGG